LGVWTCLLGVCILAGCDYGVCARGPGPGGPGPGGVDPGPVSITSDTNDADLKQRREIRHGRVDYSNQAPVRAALHGLQVLLSATAKDFLCKSIGSGCELRNRRNHYKKSNANS